MPLIIAAHNKKKNKTNISINQCTDEALRSQFRPFPAFYAQVYYFYLLHHMSKVEVVCNQSLLTSLQKWKIKPRSVAELHEATTGSRAFAERRSLGVIWDTNYTR